MMLALTKIYRSVISLFLLVCTPAFIYSDNCLESSVSTIKQNIIIEANKNHPTLSYYLYISDFISSFITITTNVPVGSSTIQASYLAGRAPIYNARNEKFGTCSASFLNMQTADGVFTDISNYLAVDNGLIISWLTPTTLINLAEDSMVYSMVTECIVEANTKIGANPFYGQKFNMIVSSDDEKIYFNLTRI
jgi:hypothetical protein